jgi:hypothetical protein
MRVEQYNEQGYLVDVSKVSSDAAYVDVVTDGGAVRVYANGEVLDVDTNEFMGRK